MKDTPARHGYRMPAEWEPHEATWLAWPAAADLWQATLPEAQSSFVRLCETIADGVHRAESLRVLVTDEIAEAAAARALAHLAPELHRIPYGDIWLRDIAPLFLTRPGGDRAAVRFGFNGWGGKYVLPHDDRVSERVAAVTGDRTFVADFVLEGGSIDLDGEGTCLTTRQCLLNPNRNPGLDEAAVGERLAEWLGARKVLWLDEGLANDHTDGHVDTLARFVAPGVVACMEPAADDPNAKALGEVARALESFTDAAGRRLRVAPLPSPGRVLDAEGRLMPASYANFYVANRTVAVPSYGVPSDADAVRAVAALFPSRRVVGIPAKAVLTGGGAFHCITQQQPRVAA